MLGATQAAGVIARQGCIWCSVIMAGLIAALAAFLVRPGSAGHAAVVGTSSSLASAAASGLGVI